MALEGTCTCRRVGNSDNPKSLEYLSLWLIGRRAGHLFAFVVCTTLPLSRALYSLQRFQRMRCPEFAGRHSHFGNLVCLLAFFLLLTTQPQRPLARTQK
jgi:hypothetical protein